MASAVANTIVVIFMTSVSLFMLKDKGLPPSVVPDWIDQLEFSGYANGQRDPLMRFCWRQAEMLPLGADSPQPGFRPALRVL
jgi:hypothetical protein